MKKLMLSLAIASTLSLSACDKETIEDVQKEVQENNTAVTASARVVFDPSNGVLSVPNDLLFQGTTDGTLNPPTDDPTDGSDPFVALSGIDGWSTVNPFTLALDFPVDTSLDGDSVAGAIHIYEAVMGGDLNDSDCTAVTRGLACKIVSELTFGVDFIAQKSGSSVAVVPLKPLKAETTYILALTDSLKDSNGRAVAGSTTYELVKQDIKTLPLGSEAQLGLQAVVNSFEAAVSGEGLASDTVIYTMAMTTQSTTKVLNTLKALMGQNLVLGGLPPVIAMQPSEMSVTQKLLTGDNPPELSAQLQALYSTGNYYEGSITLPYYLGVPTAENPKAPVENWWTARCDSGAMIAGLAATNPAAIPVDPVSANDGFCQQVGLRDLSFDTERNLTKFNPVPQAQAEDVIDVQMTVPAISPVTDAVRASYGLPALTVPDNGWPVVMMQHGITSKKEDMLALTGILSTFGFATVAIDHPLHGSRGFDLDPREEAPGDEINASTVSATHYMNLASLLTTRDNMRQSTIDMLGLRLGLNAVGGAVTSADLDTSQVHFIGHSLGAITGINFVALANTPLDPNLDGLFRVTSNSQAMPGTMVANFLMESGAFGDVIKSSLTAQASPEFQAFVASQFTESVPTEAELVGAYQLFYANLTAEQQAGLNATFSQFAFAAQTVTGSGDPVNYAAQMAATETPTHLIEVVGDGVDNLSDQVIPNRVSTSPLGGTEGAIALLGLSGISETTPGSGAVRFLNGHHSSILTPAVRPEAPDALLNAAATQEMQTQVALFFFSQGQAITVVNDAVVE